MSPSQTGAAAVPEGRTGRCWAEAGRFRALPLPSASRALVQGLQPCALVAPPGRCRPTPHTALPCLALPPTHTLPLPASRRPSAAPSIETPIMTGALSTAAATVGTVAGTLFFLWPIGIWYQIRQCEKPKYTVLKTLGQKTRYEPPAPCRARLRPQATWRHGVVAPAPA